MTEPMQTETPSGRLALRPRLLALLVGAAIAAPCIAVSLTALGAPESVAHLAAAFLVIGGLAIANRWAPASVAELGKGGRLLFVIWLFLAAGAVYRISSLALFIDDASRTEHAYQRTFRELDDPDLTRPFFLRHNCSTCYLIAAQLAGNGAENLYDRKYYRNAEVKTQVLDEIGGTFDIDQYQYPPPFLLGPHLALLTGLDFFQIRSLWFAFSVMLFVLASGAITVWICGWSFGPLWLIWPAILITPSVIATLQIGNAHPFMILIAVLAMVCFEKRWNALGGGLLAYATLSKLFPGILIAYLLFKRDWRAFAWTVTASVALCGLTLLAFGTAPFKAFFDHQLPALASGDAFSFAFVIPAAMLANSSIMGILFNLQVLGFHPPWETGAAARALTWIYSLVPLAVVFLVSRRRRADDPDAIANEMSAETRLDMVRVWIALIVLAQLRSPFLPGIYGNTAILLLLALLLPLDRVRPARLILVAVGMIAYSVVLPLPVGPASSTFDFAFSTIATLVAAGLAVVVALRATAPALPRPGSG